MAKTVKFKDAYYVGDPMNAVRIFNNFEADELIFLDIDAHKTNGTISAELVEKIGSEAFMPFSVGCGIKTLESAKKIIESGAEKVVINTAAAETPELISKIAENLGSQSVIVSVDVKKDFLNEYKVCVRGGGRAIADNLRDYVVRMEKLGAGEIIINSIDRDGTMSGYDADLIQVVSETVKIPVIALGGAGGFSHFVEAVKAGASAVAAGSMFLFYGSRKAVLISYPSEEEKAEIFRVPVASHVK